MLGPVRSRALWTVSGLAVQAAGLGGVTAFLWARLRHQDAGGHLTAATFRLMWHGEVHTRTGVAVLVTGAVIYVSCPAFSGQGILRLFTRLPAFPAARP